MRTTYYIIATFKDFSTIEMKVEVPTFADALCLARGYMSAVDARRVSLRTSEHGVVAEYTKS